MIVRFIAGLRVRETLIRATLTPSSQIRNALSLLMGSLKQQATMRHVENALCLHLQVLYGSSPGLTQPLSRSSHVIHLSIRSQAQTLSMCLQGNIRQKVLTETKSSISLTKTTRQPLVEKMESSSFGTCMIASSCFSSLFLRRNALLQPCISLSPI